MRIPPDRQKTTNDSTVTIAGVKSHMKPENAKQMAWLLMADISSTRLMPILSIRCPAVGVGTGYPRARKSLRALERCDEGQWQS